MTGVATAVRTHLGTRWLLDAGPLAAVLVLLWVKLVYFGALIPGVWWATDDGVTQWTWLRPTFHVLHAIRAQPQALVATLATLLLLIGLLPLLSRLSRFLVLLLLDFILTSLGLIDVVHVHFFADVVSLSDAVVAPMILGVLPRVVESVSSWNAIYYVDILVGLLLAQRYHRASRHIPRVDRHARVLLSFGLLSAGLVLAIPTLRTVWLGGAELLGHSSPRLEIVPAIGIVPYHVSDVIFRLTAARPTIDAQDRQRIQNFLEETRRKRQAQSPLFGRARGRNLIVVNAESLQAFPIGLTIDGQPVTPHLSTLARDSLQFVNFYDQTHLGTTSDAEFVVMQSLHPLASGVLSNRYSGNQYRGLPRVLAEHGYATLSACAAPDYFWNMNLMHRALGFQRSFFESSFHIAERVGPWLSDREFFAQTIPILKAQPTPFMAFLLTSSNHHPYRVPPGSGELSLGAREGTLLGDYLQSVRYFDRAFGGFIDQLRQAGLLETSVIVMYGDHHGFLNNTDLAALLGFPENDEYRALETRKRVPLLIRLPHGEQAGVQTVAGGHIDIAPTVLNLLGIRDASSVMLGADLTAGSQSVVVFRDGSFTDGATWYVHNPASRPSRCYESNTGHPVDCGIIQEQHRRARERLEISDLIVRGDLIPTLTGKP